ncbi:putative ubiquitin-conjugating enzyme E2-binding protein 1 [Monocercomonoides exilis]|uniref:putative ubiquitin-conjugating enzyme E2-binding protein 1 n=1 Tax=Monocercomonoides exilis TaxID=2049356 RepID=UPI003559F341|nr:putative ubiquitin-conjugating enzyme E2-binding protein 1 [Monocercomonoides exilis]|eukprot:MONOS_1975.1-p1 / transcript=MONOS_1975.1 / gene=MONOS_1975 / organism=Monocercomonoides_exilis_PA203 / gene_product=ubiquitin-conjugating enzyme E2-binding protein 1 / transcript_product=ubiquitin-conjugating enzyme E2-binding protein 1 / location=Mono_scaffold00038:36704-38997(+) / protein_length=487 / sequence_SO=supercontig / SO=protein_coding / is_pseudo=false
MNSEEEVEEVVEIEYEEVEEEEEENEEQASSSSLTYEGEGSEPFVFLKREYIQTLIEKMIEEVQSFTSLNADEAMLLLIQNGWNREKLSGIYIEDRSKALREAGIVDCMPSSSSTPSTSSAPSESTTMTCDICYDDFTFSPECQLRCSHIFCHNCLAAHVTSEISKGQGFIRINCPEGRCTVAMYPSLIRKLLDERHAATYDQFIQNSFIERQKRLKYCPFPGCNYVAKKQLYTNDVKCLCGHSYCFECQKDAHLPATCKMMEEWDQMLQKESGTFDWIKKNTKPCPNCFKPIEKNKGCHYMRCTQCKHEFCWMCLRPWSTHNDHFVCNTPAKDIKDPHALSEKRVMLDYNQHYHDHWEEHKRSLQYAMKEQKEQLKGRIQEYMRLHQCPEKAAEFIAEALDVLIDCRKVLVHSYILAFSMKESSHKELFEFMQADLEKNTEKLSFLTELPVNQIDRMQLLQYTANSKQYLEKLTEAFSSGNITAAY